MHGERIVQLDRRKKLVLDEAGVRAKFGIAPTSIPDWLALVGDDADGIPGVPKWGAQSASTVLAHYLDVEAIPDDAAAWQVRVRGAAALAASLAEALLWRRLATLRTDVPLPETVDELRWRGAADDLQALCAEIGYETFLERGHARRDG